VLLSIDEVAAGVLDLTRLDLELDLALLPLSPFDSAVLALLAS